MISFIGWTLAAIAVWCIFWWIVGYIKFCYLCPKESRNDGNFADIGVGAFFEITVIRAPVFWPQTIIMHLVYMMDTEYWRRRQEPKAAKWLVEKLNQKGIKVVSKDEDGCAVLSKVNPAQEDAYREVYGAAIKKFFKLGASRICREAMPIAPFNKEWADKIGLKEYAAPVTSPPCMNCGKVEQLDHYKWGNEEIHKLKIDKWWVWVREKNDSESSKFEGVHICDACCNNYYSVRGYRDKYYFHHP